MFYRLSKEYGKQVCVVLYSVFGWLAARKKPLPLLILLGLHGMEYFTEGRKLAAQHGIGRLEALCQCLAFGFTWWLPLKKG